MEVLIKIPDKYVSEDKSIYEMLLSMGKDKVKGAVKLLPKGHGRLKDVSKIYNHIDALNRGKDKGKFTGVLAIINMAETIIEADKENK